MIDQSAVERKAKEKLDIVAAALFNCDPIMLRALCMVDKKPCPTQDTIGLDTHSNPPALRYNPNFINAISMEVLEHIITSEGFKILLKHCTTRLYEPKQLSALASDVTISDIHKIMNAFMSEADRKILSEFKPTSSKLDLDDGLYYEEYYRNLLENYEQTIEKINQIWKSMSDEEKKEMIKNAINQQQQSGQSNDTNGNEEGEGEGEGEGNSPPSHKSDNRKPGEYKPYNNPADAIKDYYDPNGTSNKDWGHNELLDAEIQQFIDENRHSGKNWGKYTGGAMANIIAANTAKISYKEILKKFARSVISTASTNSRMKINRRFDLQQPGHRHIYTTKIVFAIDTSGSMSDADLAECFAVINACCKHTELTYILFDTQITQIETKLKKAKAEFHVTGRGGTNFQDVVDFTETMKADGLIIATDGCAPNPNMPSKCSWKLLWLMTNKKMTPPLGATGYVCHLDRYESHY